MGGYCSCIRSCSYSCCPAGFTISMALLIKVCKDLEDNYENAIFDYGDISPRIREPFTQEFIDALTKLKE